MIKIDRFDLTLNDIRLKLVLILKKPKNFYSILVLAQKTGIGQKIFFIYLYANNVILHKFSIKMTLFYEIKKYKKSNAKISKINRIELKPIDSILFQIYLIRFRSDFNFHSILFKF